jgi:glycosyltransferase involved in cell wall biosynthesis
MINLMAPINQLGYGVAGLNILKALQKKTEVALHVIGQPQVTNEKDVTAVKEGLRIAKYFDHKAPCVKIWHQNDMAEFVGKGEHVGFPIFELDKFNEVELHHLNSCERLFVCSQWAKEVVMNQCPPMSYKGVPIEEFADESRVNIVPLGVDTEIFKPATPVSKDKIIFFNCGKWEIRKGHDILIEAFKQVVKEYDNVELWMMCSNPFNSKEEDVRWAQLYNHPKVKLIPRAETQTQVYNIMTQVDCGVFPSRAEGWNLELLEMMSIGKHVITTNYSAHTEFCTKENATLIDIYDTEPAFDGKWFFGQGNWAKITPCEINILTQSMKDFVKNYDWKANQAGIETAKKFSWENTAETILKSLEV